MINIWRLIVPLNTHYRLAKEEGVDRPLEIYQKLHPPRLGDSQAGFHGGHLGDRPTPAAVLTIPVKDFDLDYFTWGGAMFVSEKMRLAMALDPSEVRFFEVDDSRSEPLRGSRPTR